MVNRLSCSLGGRVERTTAVSTGSLIAEVVSPSAGKFAAVGEGSWREVDANFSGLLNGDQDKGR